MSKPNDGSISFGDSSQIIPGSIVQTQPPLTSTWNYKYEPNQIFPQLSNVTSLMFAEGTVSASRKQMFGGSHIQQCLVFDGATPRRIQTGQEVEYGKATISTKIRRDAVVIAIIPFYNSKTLGADAIRHNPEDIVVLEYQDNGEIDHVSMKEYCSNHQYFGFKYKNTDKAKGMHSNRYPIAAGTILQDSPSKRSDGNYCYGINLNVLFATLPETAEDGILLSEEVVPWFTTRKYEKRTVTYGSTHFALNLFGTDGSYKPFQNIGDYIREDGLLMVTRAFNENFSPVEMSEAACKEVNYIFDKLCCVSQGRGRIVDIRVIADPNRQHNVPALINEQAMKYDSAARVFYRAIWDLYSKLRNRKDQVNRFSRSFKNLAKHAYAVLRSEAKSEEQRVQQIYRGAPMDDVTIEFVVEYEVTPTTGFKFTDTVGGKGVGVRIMKKEHMPIDAQGNRAQIVMDSIASVSRQNISRLYEQFFNAASRDLTKEICNHFGVFYPGTHGQKLNMADKMRVKDLFDKNDTPTRTLWNRFLQYNDSIAPEQGDFYHDVTARKKESEHMVAVMENGIYLRIPPDNDPEWNDIMDKLIKDFMPFVGPVTYMTHAGIYETTHEAMLMGEVYFIMLEKTGDDCSAVSSGKLQSIGILAHINNQDKFSSPWRQQSIRFWGETEFAIGTAYMGDEVMAEIHNRNNSITAHRSGVYNILRAPNPMNIEKLIDRNESPLSDDKPVELVKHLGKSAGWEIAYEPYVEHEPKPEQIRFIGQ